MKTLKIIVITIVINTIAILLGYGQSGSAKFCIDAEPLCAATQFYYPNTSGINFAESGPDYGCLFTQVNPSWFYLQIAQDGDIQLRIEQSNTVGGVPNLDVDFIIYGPFSDFRAPCTDELTSANTVDCSFEVDFVEFVDIPNTQAGEYYLLLITNFSIQPGFITVTQIAGAATTNCVLLADPVTSEAFACTGETIALDATTPNANYYIWYEDDGSGTENYVIINGISASIYNVTGSNTYRAEAYDVDNVLLEKYEFQITFFQAPIMPSNITTYTICDNLDANDGIGQFDLSGKDSEILNELNDFDFSVSYYANVEDALATTNQLPLLYTNTLPLETIYVRIDNTSSNDVDCFDVGSFTINVNLLPEIVLEDHYILCVNTNGTETIVTPPIIQTGLDNATHRFIWRLNGVILPTETGSTLVSTQDGQTSVEAIDLATNCSATATTMVQASSPPMVSASVITDAFADNHMIQAIANGVGIGDYLFSIDNGPWQDSGVFNNVSFGVHTISAIDVNGCGLSSTEVIVIDYPLFFTPNADGFHDTWNIIGLANQLQARIFVFDRYGKLLKQLSPNSSGWDGTYNGALMPTSDYWFTVEYIEPRDGALKQFKAHFTLKR